MAEQLKINRSTEMKDEYKDAQCMPIKTKIISWKVVFMIKWSQTTSCAKMLKIWMQQIQNMDNTWEDF